VILPSPVKTLAAGISYTCGWAAGAIQALVLRTGPAHLRQSLRRRFTGSVKSHSGVVGRRPLRLGILGYRSAIQIHCLKHIPVVRFQGVQNAGDALTSVVVQFGLIAHRRFGRKLLITTPIASFHPILTSSQLNGRAVINPQIMAICISSQ